MEAQNSETTDPVTVEQPTEDPRAALRAEIEAELREKLRGELEAELREKLRGEVEAELREKLREEVAKEYEAQRRKAELQRVRQSLIEEYELNSEQIEVLDLLQIEDPKELALRVERLFGRQRTPKVTPPQIAAEPEVFTVAQIKDPAFWRQTREKILRAAAEGRIVE